MPKKRSSNTSVAAIPRFDPPGAIPPEAPAPAAPAAVPIAEAPPNGRPRHRTITIEVPVAPIPEDAYLTRHIDCRLTLAQRRGCRALFEGLIASNAFMADGRGRPQSIPDAVRYVLERIDAALEAQH